MWRGGGAGLDLLLCCVRCVATRTMFHETLYVSCGRLCVLDDCRPYEASVFETTIRIVGGMLAAYELSQDHMYIDRSGHTSNRINRILTVSNLCKPHLCDMYVSDAYLTLLCLTQP